MNNNGEKKEYGRKDDAGDEGREAERGELDRCADRRGAGVVDGDKSADEEQTEDSAEGEVVTVCAQGGLRMRKKPRGRYMKMILDGTQLVVLEEKGGWLRVEYRGYTGWVSGEYCCKAGED